MHIQFDTASLTPNEAEALIQFLETMISGSDEDTLSNGQSPFGLSIPQEIQQAQQALDTLAQADPAPTQIRKRRTKAEIAADEAATSLKASGGQAAEPATTGAAEVSTAAAVVQQALAEPTTAGESALKSAPLSPDDLRALLNSYIARHSMEDAISVLKSFNCNRVTEALALEPVALAKLAEALRG